MLCFHCRGTTICFRFSISVGPGLPSESPLSLHLPEPGLPARAHPCRLRARSSETVPPAEVRPSQHTSMIHDSRSIIFHWLFILTTAANPSRWPTPSQRRYEEAWPTTRPRPRPSAASDSPSPASSPTETPLEASSFCLWSGLGKKPHWFISNGVSLLHIAQLPSLSFSILWRLTPGATRCRQISHYLSLERPTGTGGDHKG